jgi:acyl carrier protein
LDDQVKVRGYRVELGEIESVLREQPGVVEAAVVALDANDGEKILVAYLVAQDTDQQDWEGIRTCLSARIPDYMIPSLAVWLPQLPLTANGKLDRAALPAPPSPTDQATCDLVEEPKSVVEEHLCSVWSEVLGIAQVDVDANFFAMGGHSLKAIQVMARARKAFGYEISIAQFFDAPTVRQLARQIEETQKQETQAMPTIPVARRDGRLPLSYAQNRLWFIDQLQPKTYLYNVPMARRLQGPLDVDALRGALETIGSRHEVLRTTFAEQDDEPYQVIADRINLSFLRVDLSEWPESARETEAERLRDEEARTPFDLAQGPLFRAQLLRLADDDYIFLLTLHHIVSDGWSSGVLWREFSTLYADAVAGRSSSLPPLPIQYADYAAWQHERLQGATYDDLLSFWRRQLAGAPASLNLPTDRPRTEVLRPEGAWERFTVPKSVTARLAALGRSEGATSFMTLLAAFTVLLSRYTLSEDIIVGTDVANRTPRELEDLIGFFINHLVIRTDLSGSPTFRELLRRVRQRSTDALAHQEMPFDRLVEALNPERRGNHTPLFQVLFVMQNVPRAALDLPGIRVTPLNTHHDVSKYDLSLFVAERNEEIVCSLLYKRELFEPQTIETMGHRFQTLLESIADAPDTEVGTLRMVSDSEKHRQQAQIDARRDSKASQLLRATRRPADVQ